MSAALEAKVEIAKLARLLGTDPEGLGYLEKVGPEGLKSVRIAATDLLFDGDRAMMSRLAAGAKVLPATVLATIAEKVFGPLLCARIAGYIEPSKAVEVASKLPPRFLADVAIEIDPRKASAVIGRIPPKQAAAVAAILSAEDEFVTMGRFLGHLTDPAIAACLEVIADDKLLPTAFVLEDKARLDPVMGMLSDERAANVAVHAAEAGHWVEALDLAEHVSEEQAGRLADVIAGLDDEILTGLVDAATAGGLWPDLLPVSRSMSDEARRRFARVEAIQRPDVLAEMVDATVELGLWEELLPLVAELPEGARRELAAIAGRREGAIPGAVEAAVVHDLWIDLVALLPGLDAETQRLIAGEVAALGPEPQAALIAAAADGRLWVPLLTIAAQLDAATQERMIELLAEADDAVVEELIRSVDETDGWEQLGELAGGVPSERLERLAAQAERLGLGERMAAILAR